MFPLTLIFLSLVAISVAQRPTYAGLSPKGYPELASRFGGGGLPDDQNTPGIANGAGIANRVGVDTSLPTQRIPTDARGDTALINRLNQWPRENRPFWLLNSDHIEQHRRGGNQQAGIQEQINGGGQQNALRSQIQGDRNNFESGSDESVE